MKGRKREREREREREIDSSTVSQSQTHDLYYRALHLGFHDSSAICLRVHFPLYAKALPEWNLSWRHTWKWTTATEFNASSRIMINRIKALQNFWKIHLLTLSGSKNKCDPDAFARVFGLEFTLKEGMYWRKTSLLVFTISYSTWLLLLTSWSCRWRRQSIDWIIVINIVIIYTSTKSLEISLLE